MPAYSLLQPVFCANAVLFWYVQFPQRTLEAYCTGMEGILPPLIPVIQYSTPFPTAQYTCLICHPHTL